MDTGKEYKSNRRRAFRIYEQVDIFYQKLEIYPENMKKRDFNNEINHAFQPPITESPDSFSSSSVDQLLPNSLSKENDTLNVNISSSGISFTCNEELRHEDYVMIRVLMLSSMTLIMTCCKVIYCKPSNPFESNRYSYTIGAQFVNLRPEDKKILSIYINKKRIRQAIVWGLFTTIFLTILAIPELGFQLLLESCNLILNKLFEVVFFIYELIGYSFDHIVEYFFHTDRRTIQITSFYIQLALYGLIGLYVSLRTIPSIIKSLLYQSQVFYYRKKSSLIYTWTQQSLHNKAGIIFLSVITIFCYGSLFI